MREDQAGVRNVFSEAERNVMRRELQSLLGLDESVLVAAISAIDGFPIVQETRDAIRATERLAPMASSLAALGTAVCRELKHRALESVLVEGQDGRFLMTHIDIRGRTVVLGIVTDKGALLGKVFAIGAECARRVRLALKG